MTNNFDFHFIAVGGVGQSALAKILLRLGYNVSGSDINDSKYVKLVRELGGVVHIGHNKDNIQGTPKVVVSSAIKEDNPEMIKARELGLEIMHRSDCLKFISEQFQVFIGLAGTHGKTTTSGLLSFILEHLEVDPSYAIGGIIPKLNINAQAHKNSKYFVAELDESDGTIQKYSPKYLVINNLEADHLDYYKNGLKDVISTFELTAQKMKDDAKIIINIDDFGSNKFIEQTCFKNFTTFALNNEKADYQAKNITYGELTSSFEVYKKGSLLGKINMIIPGLHNIYNALAIVSVLDELGFKFDDYAKYFSEFSGMGRRFQIIAQNRGVTIIDDYAHHPHEIQSTLSAIKNIERRKIGVFEPHRYTRLKGLWAEFLESFDVLDELYVLETFSAGDKFNETYNSKTFVEEIKKRGISAHYITGDMDIAGAKIAPDLKEGDLLITLGAGNVTKICGVINGLLSA